MTTIRRLAVIVLTTAIGGCTNAPATTAPSPVTAPVEAPTPTPAPMPTPVPAPDSVARYLVTFDSSWSRQTHPTEWPDDAHYSGLIGGTHNDKVMFWAEGQPASPGIQAMAERGRKSPLDQEVMDAIAAGSAQHVLSGDAIGRSPGAVALEFEVSVNFPRVTLVSMVAPSPDWFVGVAGLPLLVDNQWVDRHVATLYPWDAGTDSGASYASPDVRTSPAALVQRLLGAPFLNAGVVPPLGTMTFTRRR